VLASGRFGVRGSSSFARISSHSKPGWSRPASSAHPSAYPFGLKLNARPPRVVFVVRLSRSSICSSERSYPSLRRWDTNSERLNRRSKSIAVGVRGQGAERVASATRVRGAAPELAARLPLSLSNNQHAIKHGGHIRTISYFIYPAHHPLASLDTFCFRSSEVVGDPYYQAIFSISSFP
jgi:hypothetical protein